MYMYEVIEKRLAELDARGTEHARAVADNIRKHYTNKEDCGGIGKAFEIACYSKFSNRANYQKQGKNDMYLTIDGKRYSVEVKTNGGRLDDCNTDLVVYAMDICNTTTKGARRLTQVQIVSTKRFFDAVDGCKARKVVYHQHKPDGVAIQVCLKGWFDWWNDGNGTEWNPWEKLEKLPK